MHCLKDFIAGFRGFQDSYFTSEKSLYSSLREGQNPKALVVACSDSRADPALVLGCKPGDIFVVRNVANLVPHREDAAEADAVTAALAYGVMHLGIEHVIVLGHSGCGGIAALLAHEKEETRDLISPWISLAGRALGRIRPLLEAGPESSAGGPVNRFLCWSPCAICFPIPGSPKKWGGRNWRSMPGILIWSRANFWAISPLPAVLSP